MKEYHIFIIWENAQKMKQEIIQDISNGLDIIKIVDVTWNKEKFCDNLSHFYGQKLPSGSRKIRECGDGKFTVVFICDSSPKYEKRKTNQGVVSVNINMFDRKEKFRSWTWEKSICNLRHPDYKGSRVHATNSEKETRHDLGLLFGISIEDLINNPDSLPNVWNKNIFGVDGWNNLEELFYILNQSVNYVVLRNFEYLPNQFNSDEHGDIDLLTDDYNTLESVIGGVKVFKSKSRVHHKVKINSQDVYFDYRYVGDGYYCKEWETEILANKVYSKSGFFQPNNEDCRYSLLYHAYIHKPKIAEDYKNKLRILFADKQTDYIAVLNDFLNRNGFTITYPNDVSVYINEKNSNMKRKLKSKIYTIVSKVDRRIFGYKLKL